MSSDLTTQKNAFEFLLKKFKDHQQFTKAEFKAATGWTDSAFKTYWSKQFATLLIPIKGKPLFRVSEVFTRFNTWNKFRNHVTQNRRVRSDYTPTTYKNVMLFEFFMPLTNEGYLRTSLDGLFYKDTIIARLKSIEIDELKSEFAPLDGELDASYYERICTWISGVFGGYSISHVNGRFKADELKSFHDASKLDRYLVDETTAVVRFIFPFKNDKMKVENQAKQIRFFFSLLFIQNIVEVINGEDEIWLLEGGLESKLHIWRASE